MRADKQLDVETLLQRLQPVTDQTRADIGLAGGERLDQGLTAGTLVKQFDVQVMLGVDAFGDPEAERRMTRRHLGPGQSDLGSGTCDRGRREAADQSSSRCGNAGSPRRFQHSPP